MGSVQPFLEGSFRSDRARGFGSIQSEAVTRVGRIRSLEEVRKTNSAIGRRVIIFLSEGAEEGSSGYEGVQRSRRARYSTLECVPGSFRLRDELRNSGAFAKRDCCEEVSHPAAAGKRKDLTSRAKRDLT